MSIDMKVKVDRVEQGRDSFVALLKSMTALIEAYRNAKDSADAGCPPMETLLPKYREISNELFLDFGDLIEMIDKFNARTVFNLQLLRTMVIEEKAECPVEGCLDREEAQEILDLIEEDDKE